MGLDVRTKNHASPGAEAQTSGQNQAYPPSDSSILSGRDSGLPTNKRGSSVTSDYVGAAGACIVDKVTERKCSKRNVVSRRTVADAFVVAAFSEKQAVARKKVD